MAFIVITLTTAKIDRSWRAMARQGTPSPSPTPVSKDRKHTFDAASGGCLQAHREEDDERLSRMLLGRAARSPVRVTTTSYDFNGVSTNPHRSFKPRGHAVGYRCRYCHSTIGDGI